MKFIRFILVAVVTLGVPLLARAQAPGQAPYPGQAQYPAQAPADESLRFSQAELDSMLAPIALYPDPLLSQLLMAATYPLDVAQAAAWSRANQGLAGDNAVRSAANEPWDPAVNSLVAFPQVLAMMDEHLEWTERLGDAFMSNPTLVTDTIQALRGRADQAGNLRSGEEVVVRRDYGNYVIEPAQPEVVYVPYYDPRTAYGQWWWPHYEPMWWNPWPGYASTPYAGFAWGYGVAVGSGFWYTSFDWPRHYIRFHSHRPYYWRGHSHSHGHRWYSDRDHRRNTRGWQSSGYNRGGYNRDGYNRSGDRYNRTGDGRNRTGDGRNRDGRGTGRGDGSDRRTERGTAPSAAAPATAGTGIERQTPRYTTPGTAAPSAATAPASNGVERRGSPRVLPAAPVHQGATSQPSQRGIERGPDRHSSQPLSRGAVAPAPQMGNATQPVQRAPAPAPASVQHAPAPSRVAREPRESRADSSSDSKPSSSESRSSDGGSRSGGGNSIGRGGGRGQER